MSAHNRMVTTLVGIVGIGLTAGQVFGQAGGVVVKEVDGSGDLLFKSASIEGFSVGGNVVTFEPYRWTSYAGGEAPDNPLVTGLFKDQYMWWAFQADNVQGLNPTFRLDLSKNLGGATGFPQGFRPVWTDELDGEGQPTNWRLFDNGVRSGSILDFSMNGGHAFTEDTIYVAQTLPYTTTNLTNHIDKITHPVTGSDRVVPLSSDNAFGAAGDFVVGATPSGHQDFRGNTVVSQDLYGYGIADVSASPTQQIVLVGGNHPAEHVAGYMFEGMVDFLIGDHPMASEILSDATIAVYPMADPEGRDIGHTRGNDSTVTAIDPTLTNLPADITLGNDSITVLDHNRTWDQTGAWAPQEVQTIRDAIATDAGTDVEWFFDFHGSGPFGTTSAYEALTFHASPDPNNASRIIPDTSGLISEMQSLVTRDGGNFRELDGGINPSDSGLLDPHSTAHLWAIAGIGAEHSFTPELFIPAASPGSTASDLEDVLRINGEFYGRALAVAMFEGTIFWREDSSPSWAGADWAQSEQVNPTPQSDDRVFIAFENGGTFAAPSVDTTVQGLELRGYGDSAGFVFEQDASVLMSSINGDVVIENAEYRIVGSTQGDVIYQNGSPPGFSQFGIRVGENSILNLGRDAGGQSVLSARDIWMDPTSRLVLHVGGSAPGEYDSVFTGGVAFLDGTLELAKPDNDNLQLYQRIDLVTVDFLGGVPDVIEGVVLDSLFGLAVNYAQFPGVDVKMSLLGDANRDGRVDGSDFFVWQSNVGASTSEWTRGDFNGDGVVNGADLRIWEDHYGLTAGSSTVFWRDGDTYSSDWDTAKWAQAGVLNPTLTGTSDVVIASSKTVTFAGPTSGPATVVNSLDVRSIGSGDLTFLHQPVSHIQVHEDITITRATYAFNDSSSGGWLYTLQTMTLGPDATLDLGAQTTGQLAVATDYVQDDQATLQLTIDNLGAPTSDMVLIINGTASLDGTLKIVTEPTFVPTLGDQFNLMMLWGPTASLAGVFSQIDGVSLDLVSVLGLAVTYDPTPGMGVQGLVTYLGDANGDLAVDALDLDILAVNMNQPGVHTWADGDFNGDGTVSFLDMSLWAGNFGLGGGGGVVPEPTSLALLLLSGSVLMRRRRD